MVQTLDFVDVFHTGEVNEAAVTIATELDGALAATPSIEARLSLISRVVRGRVAFSTSLGLEDQALLHAIAATKAPVDVFTLDTGRHFQETLDTIHASERHFGLRIRVPCAGCVGDRGSGRPGRHLRVSQFSDGSQGVLRCAQSAPVAARASRSVRLGHRAKACPIRESRACAVLC